MWINSTFYLRQGGESNPKSVIVHNIQMKRLVENIIANLFFFFKYGNVVSIQGEEVVSLHCNYVLVTNRIFVVLVCQ